MPEPALPALNEVAEKVAACAQALRHLAQNVASLRQRLEKDLASSKEPPPDVDPDGPAAV